MKYTAKNSQKVFRMIEQHFTKKLQKEQEQKLEDYYKETATATQKEIEEITRILNLMEV